MEENVKQLTNVIFCALFVLSGCTFDTQDKFVKPIEKVMPSVVEIQVVGMVPHPLLALLDSITGEDNSDNPDYWVRAGVFGSGVYVSPKGYILTCAHLFEPFKKILAVNVTNYNEETVAGVIISVGEKVDLAVIKTPYFKDTPYVKLADPRKLKVGQDVFAIGSPLGLSFSVTSGIISALYRDFEFAYNMTQSDVSLNPGNSGGPLFNLKGELVGINSFMVPPVNAAIFTGLGFSVQAGQCLEFLVKTSQKEKDLKNKKWIDILYRWL